MRDVCAAVPTLIDVVGAWPWGSRSPSRADGRTVSRANVPKIESAVPSRNRKRGQPEAWKPGSVKPEPGPVIGASHCHNVCFSETYTAIGARDRGRDSKAGSGNVDTIGAKADPISVAVPVVFVLGVVLGVPAGRIGRWTWSGLARCVKARTVVTAHLLWPTIPNRTGRERRSQRLTQPHTPPTS